jgi:DNA helicase IV
LEDRSGERGSVSEATELRREQDYVTALYARLDALRDRTERELAAVRRQRPSGTHQNRSERDAFASLYEQRLAQLRAVEDRLCFGRFDTRDGSVRYVGRIGLSDDERRQLLVDWRAPAARWFYQATPAAPGDVVRRRHLTTRGRSVVAIEDEALDLAHLDAADASTLTGEGALLAALNAHRTGRMGDIVATIQTEQDDVIRADLPGVLVVQGGPGTGKTAVALHRAAYLLYTHRDRLARSGVLLVGPNALFLRYIEKVLPSLGETGVVMMTPGELFPGVVATVADEPEVAAVKGDARMADVVAAAVRARQRPIAAPRTMDVDGHPLVLRPHAVAAAQARARRSNKPHNLARVAYAKDLLEQLAAQYARALGVRLDGDNRADLLADLRASKDVRREINLTWMPLTPQRLLEDLFADPRRLAEAAPQLSPAERRALLRDRGSEWTTSDVPLLDEAAEMLGADDTAERHAAQLAAQERQAAIDYARGALEMTGAGAMVSAETLAARFADDGPTLSTAERAVGDRTWAYGHIVVDEAQELSPMAWRVLMRRCPTKSMTLVGDVAQTGSAAGASSWEQVLAPHVGDRWRLAELHVNYRTPAQVMEIAADVLVAAGIDAPAPRSVRIGAFPPIARAIPDLTGDRVAALDAIAEGVRAEVDRLGDGRLAVITPTGLRAPVRAALRERLDAVAVGDGAVALDATVAVLTVAQAKGLEFDTVVLVEPADLVDESPRGANDLYVALTRPTQRLAVLHARPLPHGMHRLVDPGATAGDTTLAG